jgi:hypothetical protein
MSERTTTYWWCMECDAQGVYQQALSGGAAEKHTTDTGHGTTSSLHPRDSTWTERITRKDQR